MSKYTHKYWLHNSVKEMKIFSNLFDCDLSATVHYKELSESQFSDLTWKPSEINEIVLPLLRERYQDRCFTAFRFHLSYFQFQNQFLACFVIRDVSVNCEIFKHKSLSIGFLRPSINGLHKIPQSHSWFFLIKLTLQTSTSINT